MGYHRAGFDVVGVDIAPQPDYPFPFIQADALQVLADIGTSFDAIHASPPCQAYSSATRDRSRHPDLYGPTRAALMAIGRPYAIENVIGAPYSHGVVLCGSMFPLSGVTDPDGRPVWVQRHRNFETSMLLFQPPCDHDRMRSLAGRPVTVTGHGDGREGDAWREYPHSRKSPTTVWPRLLDMAWVRDPHSVRLAIPPAYTEWIGRQLLAAVEAAA
jgi:DNA (cytosine-5)-methyltransferase 1